MGTYNANQWPDIARAQVIARNYNLVPDKELLTDEWTVDSTNRVSNFADGTGNIKIKVKSDPNNVSIS